MIKVKDSREQKYLDVVVCFKTCECKKTEKKAHFTVDETFIYQINKKRKMHIFQVFLLQKVSQKMLKVFPLQVFAKLSSFRYWSTSSLTPFDWQASNLHGGNSFFEFFKVSMFCRIHAIFDNPPQEEEVGRSQIRGSSWPVHRSGKVSSRNCRTAIERNEAELRLAYKIFLLNPFDVQ